MNEMTAYQWVAQATYKGWRNSRSALMNVYADLEANTLISADGHRIHIAKGLDDRRANPLLDHLPITKMLKATQASIQTFPVITEFTVPVGNLLKGVKHATPHGRSPIAEIEIHRMTIKGFAFNASFASDAINGLSPLDVVRGRIRYGRSKTDDELGHILEIEYSQGEIVYKSVIMGLTPNED